jgi:hypothetical protein
MRRWRMALRFLDGLLAALRLVKIGRYRVEHQREVIAQHIHGIAVEHGNPGGIRHRFSQDVFPSDADEI